MQTAQWLGNARILEVSTMLKAGQLVTNRVLLLLDIMIDTINGQKLSGYWISQPLSDNLPPLLRVNNHLCQG